MNGSTARRLFHTVVVLTIAAATLPGPGQSAADYKTLLDSGQVFGLREASQHSTIPDLYRGAVLSSMNKVQAAERVLKDAVSHDPDPDVVYQAHDILGNLYQRNGMYKEELRELDAALAERPTDKDIRNVRPLFEALATSGDMEVTHVQPSKLRLAPDDDIPFTINGHSDSFAFDTGSMLSVMSEGEAVRLGLSIKAVTTNMSESSGNGVAGLHIAVAHDMRIGGLSLRNVPFLVLPDSNQPFVSMPPHEGHRGLIGLPILLAMKSIRWTPKTSLEYGLQPRGEQGEPNLLFYQGTPVVRVIVDGRALNFALDTGAVDTDLNPIFAKEFPALVSQGKKDTNTITGFGGSKDYVAVLLPPVQLDIAGRTVTLPHPYVSTEQGLGGGDSKWAGNLGNDALRQAHAITFDFENLSLHLE